MGPMLNQPILLETLWIFVLAAYAFLIVFLTKKVYFYMLKKGFTKDVIISILTAKGTPDHEKMRGLEAFIYDYIIKPFDINKLTKLIANQHLILSRNMENA